MVMTGRARKSCFRNLIFLVSFLALLPATNHLAAAGPSNPAKKILLLYSYQSVLPANLEWDGAICPALKGPDAEPLEFYTEFLDLAQFPDESYLHSLIKLLQDKYGRRKVDLLIPIGDWPFIFCWPGVNSSFPGCPWSFVGRKGTRCRLKRA
jgi:hypothetical protein